MKLMVLGFPKSGTSTLQKALKGAGLSAVHWRHEGQFVGKLMYDSYFTRGDPWPVELEHVACITQADVCKPADGLNYWPNLDFNVIAALRSRHPNCRFLLNTRKVPDIISSISRWGDMRHRFTVSDIPGLPTGRGAHDHELATWIEGHYRACREFFSSGRRLFGSNRTLLEVAIEDEDTPRRIAKWLGVSLPWWGVANANPGVRPAASPQRPAITSNESTPP